MTEKKASNRVTNKKTTKRKTKCETCKNRLLDRVPPSKKKVDRKKTIKSARKKLKRRSPDYIPNCKPKTYKEACESKTKMK